MDFHNAPFGVNGPVVFGMISPFEDVDDRMIVINATGITVSGIWQDSDAAFGADLLSNFIGALLSGELYINVHTPANPGGEIRGQIFTAVVPEPVSGVLLVSGILGLAVFRKRLSRQFA